MENRAPVCSRFKKFHSAAPTELHRQGHTDRPGPTELRRCAPYRSAAGAGAYPPHFIVNWGNKTFYNSLSLRTVYCLRLKKQRLQGIKTDRNEVTSRGPCVSQSRRSSAGIKNDAIPGGADKKRENQGTRENASPNRQKASVEEREGMLGAPLAQDGWERTLMNDPTRPLKREKADRPAVRLQWVAGAYTLAYPLDAA